MLHQVWSWRDCDKTIARLPASSRPSSSSRVIGMGFGYRPQYWRQRFLSEPRVLFDAAGAQVLRSILTSLCEALTREEFKCLEMEDNKTNQLYRRRYVHAFSHIISIVIALLLVAFILGSTSPARTKRLLRRVASHPGRNWLFGGRGRRRRL